MKSLFFVLPALLLGLTACGAPVAAVTLPDTVQVEKTQTAETAVLYEDADGREVSPRRAALTEWRWSVADDTIAEVDPSGIVTGLRGGSTTLTLQSADGKISASCPVQVSSPLRGIALDDYTLYFDDELVTWITADGTRESDYAYASRVGAVCHLLPEDTTDHPAVTYHIADERIARFDEATDTVSLMSNAFVPSDAQASMLGFLGDNVGDHLAAAVSNVLASAPPHFEQAVFADELSAQSVTAVRQFVLTQWKGLMHAAVPLLEGLIEDDRKAGRPQDRRLRIGLYSYATDMAPSSSPDQTESKK